MNTKEETSKPRSVLPSPGAAQPAQTKRPVARSPRAVAASAGAAGLMPKRKKRFTL